MVHKTSTYLPLICITSVMHVQKALNFELWLLRTIQVALELKFNVFLMQKSLAVVLANGWVWRELHLQQHMNPIWKKCLCGTFVDTTVQNTYLSNTLAYLVFDRHRRLINVLHLDTLGTDWTKIWQFASPTIINSLPNFLPIQYINHSLCSQLKLYMTIEW